MAFLRPLFKAFVVLGTAVYYLVSIPFVRRQLGKVARWPFRKSGTGKVVDAKGTVIEK